MKKETILLSAAFCAALVGTPSLAPYASVFGDAHLFRSTVHPPVVLGESKVSVFGCHVVEMAQQRKVSLEEAVRALRSWGVDGVDLWYQKRDMESNAKLLAAGLKPASLIYFADLAHTNNVTRNAAAIAYAREVGAPRIMLVPGFRAKGEDRTDAWAAMKPNLADFLRRAGEAGVEIDLEDFDSEDAVVGSQAHLAEAFAAFPTLGHVLDTGNYAFWKDDVLAAQRVFASRIRHVHIKDRDAVDPAKSVPAGTGTIPVKEVVLRLKQADYPGWITIECFGSTNMWDAVRTSATFVNSMIRAAGAAGAEPVWPKGLSTERNACFDFTCEIPSAPVARDAVLRYAAASFARVTLDGAFVSFGPARAPTGWHRLEEIPLRLEAGRSHRLNIEVVAYNINTYCESERPGVLQAEVVADGKVIAETRAEKGDFTARRGARVKKVSRYSFQRGFNEAYRLPAPAAEAEPLEASAPLKLLPRRAPAPDFSLVERVTHVKDYFVAYDKTRKVRENWGADGKGSQKGYLKETQDLCVFEEIQRYVPTNAATGMKGVLYGFDRLETGFPSVRVKCTAPGRVVMRFAEVLKDGVLRPERDCTGNGIVWDLTAPGEYDLVAFEPYAFKFIDVIADASIVAEAPRMRRFRNATMDKAQYRGTDPVIRSIFEAARNTIAQNSTDIFMDCPGRERAGWLCDSFFSARSAQFFSGRTDVERAYLENFAKAERFVGVPDGMVAMCYPADHPDGCFIPNWAMWFVIEIDDFVRRTGDRAFADGLKARVDGVVRFLAKYENADGLLEKLPAWVFVEWSDSNRHTQDVNYPSNMLWAETLDAASRILGDPALAAKAKRVRETVCRQSFDGTWFHDNATRQKDGSLKRGGATTETCQYYAFWTKTATPASHAALWKTMTTDFGPQRKQTKKHPSVAFSNAFIGNYLRLMCLSREGLKEQVLKEVRGYFAGMAETTGTLWEHDSTEASCCHGFASYVGVLIDEATR